MNNRRLGRINSIFMSILLALSLLTITSVDSSVQLKNKDLNVPLVEYDFVLIAYDDWYEYDGSWDLQSLADWHNTHDSLHTYIVALSSILENPLFWVNGTWGDGNPANPYRRLDENGLTDYELFNDTQAKVRNYLRYAHAELGVRYALLVGDHEHIRCRRMYAHGEGAPAEGQEYNDNVPADMYYGCLNGTWNDDEDIYSPSGSGWGENATLNNASGVDEADWTWEVAIGRICPDTATELSNAIRKTISYMSLTGDEPYLYITSLAGHYAGWGGLAEWGAEYSKQLNATTCDDWGHTTYGFDPSIYTCNIVDANPSKEEGMDYTDENTHRIFNDGVHVWYQAGHGDVTGWVNAGYYGDTFDTGDVQALTNTKYSLVYSSIPCLSGKFDNSDCLAEAFVNEENGAFASIMNSRYGWGSFINLHSTCHYMGREFFDAYFHEDITRLGDMLVDAAHDCDWLISTDDPGTIRWALFERNLFGSPATRLKLPTTPGGGAELAIESITGGVGVSAEIRNRGNLDATNVNWTVEFDNGIYLMPPRGIETGTIETLPAGGKQNISTNVFGIGGIFRPCNVTISVDATNADPIEQSIAVRVLLFLVLT